jgi:hypothetical protein
MFTWGVFTSYWADYAVKKRIPDSMASQWQVPIALQMAPASMLATSLLFIPESVRWLVKRGRVDEAWASLSWIRGGDSPEARAEFEEIKMATMVETNALEGFKQRELLKPQNRKRFIMAFAIFLCQQSTGATALAYFGPQVFKLVVGPGDRNLLVTGIFGFIKVLACGIFVLFVSERFGRKSLLMVGALGMATCMFVVAILDKVKPPGQGAVMAPGYAMVGLIFLNIVFYNTSWGPLPWIYVSEVSQLLGSDTFIYVKLLLISMSPRFSPLVFEKWVSRLACLRSGSSISCTLSSRRTCLLAWVGGRFCSMQLQTSLQSCSFGFVLKRLVGYRLSRLSTCSIFPPQKIQTKVKETHQSEAVLTKVAKLQSLKAFPASFEFWGFSDALGWLRAVKFS